MTSGSAFIAANGSRCRSCQATRRSRRVSSSMSLGIGRGPAERGACTRRLRRARVPRGGTPGRRGLVDELEYLGRQALRTRQLANLENVVLAEAGGRAQGPPNRLVERIHL